MIDALIYTQDESLVSEYANFPTVQNNGHICKLVRINDVMDVRAEVLSSCEAGGDTFDLLTADGRAKLSLANPRPIITIPERTVNGEVRPSYTFQAPEKFGGFA